MNARLQKEYDALEERDREKVLRNDIRLDTLSGTHIWGVMLGIDPAEGVKDAVCRYQEKLREIEPDAFFLPSRSAQHMTFNQVIFWGGEYELGLEGTWEQISGEFLAAFRMLNKKFDSFPITFSRLIATTSGVIWCAYDENDELETLRYEFAKILPFPKETPRFNHIIHTTVARYRNKLKNPARVLDILGSASESVAMSVDKISLKEELVFPSLEMRTLAWIELA